ncbi:zn-finger domain-containing protein [Gigaspora margarita]|uniref:Zn-finger domain-containing protein n=1 Tax=Gigaspora margarita TaxID=4874 RepID=A0A8H3XLB3_GIGMA|nr:zn-finger domain-containing protein [Gigaspora margarita]
MKVYEDWNNMYLMSRYEEFSEKDLENFKYEPLNGFSTETYESLHKDFVKSPYYLTNKKDIEIQILKMKLIRSWAKQFVDIFQEFSSSRLKFPKLHSWVYHTTDLIKKYEPLNGFSTETYESLHKDFVKSPYYLTNKKDIEIQILKMVQRQDIVTNLSAKSKQNAKIIYPFKFNNLI